LNCNHFIELKYWEDPWFLNKFNTNSKFQAFSESSSLSIVVIIVNWQLNGPRSQLSNHRLLKLHYQQNLSQQQIISCITRYTLGPLKIHTYSKQRRKTRSRQRNLHPKADSIPTHHNSDQGTQLHTGIAWILAGKVWLYICIAKNKTSKTFLFCRWASH